MGLSSKQVCTGHTGFQILKPTHTLPQDKIPSGLPITPPLGLRHTATIPLKKACPAPQAQG